MAVSTIRILPVAMLLALAPAALGACASNPTPHPEADGGFEGPGNEPPANGDVTGDPDKGASDAAGGDTGDFDGPGGVSGDAACFDVAPDVVPEDATDTGPTEDAGPVDGVGCPSPPDLSTDVDVLNVDAGGRHR
ncbi:MAG: hypothetical protein ACQEXJ_04465 [Myxococcota bacterium]